jgi:hypothetical protein
MLMKRKASFAEMKPMRIRLLAGMKSFFQLTIDS